MLLKIIFICDILIKNISGDKKVFKKDKDFCDKTNFESSQYLHINSCGKQNHNGNGYPLLRSGGRVDFHLLYITQGEGVLLEDDNEIILEQGQIKIYKPYEKQHYRFSPPFTQSYWLHFAGIGSEEIMQKLNLWIKSIYNIGMNENIIRLFDDIIRETTLKEHCYQSICEGKLLELLGYISRIASSEQGINSSDKSGLIYSAIEQMREDPLKKTDTEKMAAMLGLSRGRFEHLFKEVTGLPPHKYQTKLRLDRSRYLLKNTQLNISEIAFMTGFSDPLYFSRIFKKTFGCPPIKYRASKERI